MDPQNGCKFEIPNSKFESGSGTQKNFSSHSSKYPSRTYKYNGNASDNPTVKSGNR
jgi:hypothetical protein